jgi:NTP pyrophosphatase (non-canonical NTP hydrolase)
MNELDMHSILTSANEYQQWTRTTAKYPRHKGVEYCLYGMVSEVGEVADKLKKPIRDGYAVDPNAISKEIGDVVWYCARLADELGVDLGKILWDNIEKLSSRKERNVISGSGDER